MPQPSVDLTASVGAGPTAQSCPYGAQVGVAAQASDKPTPELREFLATVDGPGVRSSDFIAKIGALLAVSCL